MLSNSNPKNSKFIIKLYLYKLKWLVATYKLKKNNKYKQPCIHAHIYQKLNSSQSIQVRLLST